MYIRNAHAKLLEIPVNAYTLLAFAASTTTMLCISYRTAPLDVIGICSALALGAFGEAVYLFHRRDKGLKIIAKRRMQLIQRRRSKTTDESLRHSLIEHAQQ